jgi:hypothetical protein
MSKSILKLVTCFTKDLSRPAAISLITCSANYQNKKLMVNGKDMSAIVQQLISPPSPVPTIKAR